MQSSSAISGAGSARPGGWPLPAAFAVWAAGSVFGLMVGAFIVPMVLGFIDRFLPLALAGSLEAALSAALILGFVGAMQQVALKHSPGLASAETVRGWTWRTMLGGVLAILGYLGVLELLGALYGDSPLLRGMSILRPGGTEVQVAAMLAGFALMGAVLSAIQWHPWASRGTLWRGVLWTISGALSWGAAGVVLWSVYENKIGNSTVYFEDMFIGLAATVTALFWASVVIALSSAVALKSPIVSIALSLLVSVVLGYMTLTGPVASAYKNYSEPLFTGPEIHPQKSLGADANCRFSEVMDFSDDGSLLGAVVSGTWTGADVSVPGKRIVLWRVPDWKLVGVIQPDQTSSSLEQVSVGAGVGAKLVAEASPAHDQVYIRRADDKSVVTTLDFRNPPGPLPEGYTFDTGSMNSTTEVVFVRTPDGREYKLSPRPVMDWVMRGSEDYAVSPDGRYIAGGYDEECVLWVWTLPAFDTGAGNVKPPATASPQPQQQPRAGEPQYLGPFKTLDIKGVYGGDVAPEGVPGNGLFSPDGQYLVTDVHQGDVNTSPDYHSALVVWRTSDWQRVLTRTLELGFPTLVFSPDSKTLAVGSDGGTIALYSTSDWTAFRTFHVPPGNMRLAFVPNGSELASASRDDETMRFWSTSDWSELRTQQIEGLCAYCYFAFSPDGRLFTADLVDRSVVNIWRVEDVSIVRTIKLPEGTLGGGPTFSRDGSVIKAIAVTSGTFMWDENYKTKLFMWSVADGQLVTEDPDKSTLVGAGENIYWKGETDPLFVLRRTAFPELRDTGSFGSFSPDGRTVVGTCDAHLLCLWKLPESLPPPTVKEPTVQSQHSQSPVATPTAPVAEAGGPLQVLSESNISRIRELNRIFSPYDVQTLAFVPGVQTTTLATASGGFELWQGLDGRPERVRRLPLDNDSRLLSFSPDGQTVLTRYGSDEDAQDELRLWRTSDGGALQTFVGHTEVVMAGALSPDGKTMASGGYDCTVRVWNVADATILHKITLSDPTGGYTCSPRIRTLAFSPDGKVLAVGSGDGIRLWSTSDYSLLRTTQTDGFTDAVTFSPDGKILASGEQLGLRLWKVSDGTLLRTLEKNEEHEAVAFSPDGSLLATGASWRSHNVGAVSIWRVADGKLLRQLEGHTNNVISLAFSPDGKLLVSGSESNASNSGDKSARIWGVR